MHAATANWAAKNQTPFIENVPSLKIAPMLSLGARPKSYGDMSVKIIATPHNHNFLSNLLAPETQEGFEFPSRVSKMGEGTNLSVLITHENKSALIVGSSGVVGSRFDGIKADVVFLSIGGLRPKKARDFWCNTVAAVGARRVFLTHWDNHQKPLPKDGTSLEPTFFEPHSDVLAEFQALAQGKVEIAIPAAQVPFNPFADLTGSERNEMQPC
jgi:L-ascorbate metabolism protein UlaG (beta-lactamase superfamily)